MLPNDELKGVLASRERVDLIVAGVIDRCLRSPCCTAATSRQLWCNSPGSITPAFTNDALVAVSAAEIGATLVHDNSRDFDAIKRYFPRLKDTVGWPAKAA